MDEDGYFKIPNKLFDSLCKIRIPGEARQMFDAIIRQTSGFNRKEAQIPTNKFIEITKLSRQSIQKARKKLLDMHLISVSKKGYTKGLTYCIQTDHDKWKVYPKKDTVSKKGYTVYPKKDTPLSETPTFDNASQGPKNIFKYNSSSICKKNKLKIDFDFRKKTFINIQDVDKERWKKAYPAIDIELEILAAAEWLIANPKNKKSNYQRFLTNWFKRNQDKAPKVIKNNKKTKMGDMNDPKVRYGF